MTASKIPSNYTHTKVSLIIILFCYMFHFRFTLLSENQMVLFKLSVEKKSLENNS